MKPGEDRTGSSGQRLHCPGVSPSPQLLGIGATIAIVNNAPVTVLGELRESAAAITVRAVFGRDLNPL